MSHEPPTKVIIIGAGWAGLAAAKTYLEVSKSPNNSKRRSVDLTVLDDSEDIGGVWSSGRLHPDLIANSPNGLYEYSDFSMVDEDHPRYEIITAKRVHEYLEAYARRFDVYDKIRFGVTVTRVYRRSSGEREGWLIETSLGEDFFCDKLIVSSGLHSKPKVPALASSPLYKGISIHSKHLSQTYVRLVSDPDIKDIVVVGGCKSAVEAISLFLDQPTEKRIHWLVRPSEQGVPIVVMKPGESLNPIAVSSTRLFGVFSPSALITTGFWYTLLHSGKWILGTFLMNLFWIVSSVIARGSFGYGNSCHGKVIEPEGTSLFYDAPYISVVLKDSKFHRVLHEDNAEKLEVLRARPLELNDKTMLVQEKHVMGPQGWYMRKVEVKADAVIWCTGYQPSLDFFSDHDKAGLGLPHLINKERGKDADEDEAAWRAASEKSAAHMRSLFPSLSNSNKPRSAVEPLTTTPFRLYNHILPLPSSLQPSHSRTLAFSSFTLTAQTALVAELSALYAVAYLEDLLPKTSNVPTTRSEAMKSISNIQSWRDLRYGPRGKRDPEFTMDTQSFMDEICKGLGIEWERKRRGGTGRSKWREWTEPYGALDYRGLIEEFLLDRNERLSSEKEKTSNEKSA